jgi:hypothetical protein
MDVIQDKDIVYDPVKKELRLAPKKETFEIPERKTELGYDDLIEKLDKRHANAEEDDLDKMLDAEEERLKPFLDSAESTISKIENEFGFDSSELNNIIRENKYSFNEYNEKFNKISENAWLQKELSEIGEKVKKEGDTRSPVEIGYDYVTNRVFDDFYDKVAKGKNFVLLQQSMDLVQEMANIDANNDEYTGETINIDGVEKPVYNSNGDRIAKSEEALRAFYKWFGDSKVVDEQGRPLVVYHGSKANNIEVFDVGLGTNGLAYGSGVYFSRSKILAESNYGKNVYNVYLREENPFFNNSSNSKEMEKLFNAVGEEYKDGDTISKITNKNEEQTYKAKEITKALKSMGYDGVIFGYNNNPAKGIEYVAFNPNQIKSIDNRGTYSLTDNNIYNQSAYHGSPNKELEGGKFDLKYAGKTTGNVHGYGVYAVVSKPSAEYWAGENGQVYELDVPEDFNLIDEQKRFSEQPENVQWTILGALEKIDGFGLLSKAIEEDSYGVDIYVALGKDVYADKHRGIEGGSTEIMKAASEFLDKIGIKGITYNYADEKNFVIFNPDDVKVIQKFYQGVSNPKGMFDANSKVIKLFENADASTLEHELAHY